MPESEPPSFATSQEEARHYRILSKDLRDELDDLKLALSDFQSSSKELEDEMEKELANTERRETELRHEAERLRNDAELWKGRHQDTLREHSKTMQHMQQELERLRASEKALRGKLRDIELDNDDLEKSERAISSTLSDVESRYNRAIERTALLQQELVDKARLQEELQRTKDELRENMEELAVTISARDQALACAVSIRTRLADLDSRQLHHEKICTVVPAVGSVATPPRQSAKDCQFASPTDMPSPDIDLTEEGISTGRDVRTAISIVPPSTKGLAHFSIPKFSRDSSAEGGDLIRSDTIHDLAAISMRKSHSPATSRARKSEGIISDMRDLTLRMQTMSQSLNKRSVMVDSAIPRPTPRKSAVVSSMRNKEVSSITRSASSNIVNRTSARPSEIQSPELFKSPPAGRPASRQEHINRATPSADSGKGYLRVSRPASRLSYGTSAQRPQTPSSLSRPLTPSQQDRRALRRTSLGPISSKRTSRFADETHIPPLPFTAPNDNTPIKVNSGFISKRSSLANSITSPTTATSLPPWR